jgi:hypothetical protein
MNRRNKHEGDWFALPLPAGGYAVGLVARSSPRGAMYFAYFFGPIRDEVPSPEALVDYTPSDAVSVGRFFGSEDDPFASGRWTVISTVTDWDRAAWPMPEFLADSSMFGGSRQASTFSDDHPARFESLRELAPHEDASAYPPDQYSPASFIERDVAKALGAPLQWDEPEPRPMEEGVTLFLSVPRRRVATARRQLFGLGFTKVDVLPEEGEIWLAAFLKGNIEEIQRSVEELERRVDDLARRLGGYCDGLEWSLGHPT